MIAVRVIINGKDVFNDNKEDKPKKKEIISLINKLEELKQEYVMRLVSY